MKLKIFCFQWKHQKHENILLSNDIIHYSQYIAYIICFIEKIYGYDWKKNSVVRIVSGHAYCKYSRNITWNFRDGNDFLWKWNLNSTNETYNYQEIYRRKLGIHPIFIEIYIDNFVPSWRIFCSYDHRFHGKFAMVHCFAVNIFSGFLKEYISCMSSSYGSKFWVAIFVSPYAESHRNQRPWLRKYVHSVWNRRDTTTPCIDSENHNFIHVFSWNAYQLSTLQLFVLVTIHTGTVLWSGLCAILNK